MDDSMQGGGQRATLPQSSFPYRAPTLTNTMKNLYTAQAPTAAISNILTRLNKGFRRL